ncbi:ergothioneine biosynthesis glutamate--cysteine ligase EgtA [Salinifilum aidingensis]
MAVSTGQQTDRHVVPVPRTSDPAGAVVHDRGAAEERIAGASFRHGPPRLLGVELEWLVHHRSDPRRPLDAAALATSLGPHAPAVLVADSPHRPLPHGSTLTLEPGGQVEISSTPATDLGELLTRVTADAAYLRERLARCDLAMADEAMDAWRLPRAVLRAPRYVALATTFDRVGRHGRLMMHGTAGIHVCLDVGEQHRSAARWAALHTLGPVLIAAFSNSPRLHRARTGWASTRMRSLLRMNPSRDGPPERLTAQPARDWARRMLDTELTCVRRDSGDWRAPAGVSLAEWIGPDRAGLDREPTPEDLDYHLTTVFPPVRPHGYFEVRYLDAQPAHDWMLPVAVLAALFREESTVDAVRELTAPAEGRWTEAARDGLADPVLARLARPVLHLAWRRLSEMEGVEALTRRLATFVAGRCAAVRC